MEQPISIITKLLSDIEEAWGELNSFLDTLDERHLSMLQDPQGWSVKDHVIHLVAWERSILYLLEGRPQYIGLGVSESVFSSNSEDEINAIIQQRHRDITAADARKRLREGHQEVLALLNSLSDSDLLQADSSNRSSDAVPVEEHPILDLIYGNTCEHFRQHLSWIKDIVHE